jgi:hypothetical protein
MSIKRRGSVTSNAITRKETNSTIGRIRSHSTISEDAEGAANGVDVVHGFRTKASTAMLPPVMVSHRRRIRLATLPSELMAKLQSKKIDTHPLSWLEFQEDCIMTACKDGKCLTASVLGCSGPTRKDVDCAILMRRARIRSGLLSRICEISR